MRLGPLDALVRGKITLELVLAAFGEGGFAASVLTQPGLPSRGRLLDGTRLALESADVTSHPRDVLLLTAPGLELDGALVRACLGEVCISARVTPQAARLWIQVQHPTDRRIEERAVVRNDQHRTWILGQKALEPLQRLHVEVVRRLIQQQQVGLAQQQRRQSEACFLTPAQLLNRHRAIDVAEAEAWQDNLRPRYRRVTS